MNEHPFGLHERPFPAAPLTAAWFAADSSESARRQMLRCAERAEGAGVLVGAPGMGKSLLLHVLASDLRGKFHIAHLAAAAVCTRRALLQSILFELGLPYRGLPEGELRLSLIDHLQPSRQCPQGMLLLIDEAHTLPLRLLEELRLLTNLVREGTPRVRLLLAGSRQLEERLAHPKLDSFQQRIAVRAYLEPWTSQETARYLRQELARCGGRADAIFTDDALRAIHVAAAGIPRLVNQIADHALTLAVAHGLTRLDAGGIQTAWSELQRLPAPWSEPAPSSSSSSIEFGVLEELADSREPQIESPPATAAVVESLVPSYAELFGDDFDAEEVVIDRFASLDVQALADRPQVITLQGQAFAREVAAVAAEPAAPQLKIVDVIDEPISVRQKPAPLAAQMAMARGRQGKADDAERGESELPFDPVYPDDEPAMPPMRIVAIDDARSETPQPHGVKAPAGGRLRNLFATLRAKKSQSDEDSH